MPHGIGRPIGVFDSGVGGLTVLKACVAALPGEDVVYFGDTAWFPYGERDPAEVSARFPARNPAFDVTPGDLVAAIVTELGVHRAPYAETLPREAATAR